MSYSSRLDSNAELSHSKVFYTILGLWCGRKITCYIRDHSSSQWAHSGYSCFRTMHRVYAYAFPIFSKRRYFIEVTLPDNLALAFCMTIESYKSIQERESKFIQFVIIVVYTFVLVYFIGLARKIIAKNLPSLGFIAPTIDYRNVNHLSNHTQEKPFVIDLASIPLKIIQYIESAVDADNIDYYLLRCSLQENIFLSRGCAAYLEKNPDKLEKYLIKSPGVANSRKALFLLNLGCLAKNDFIVKAAWENLCLNNHFEVLQAYNQSYAIDYLIDKKEFSNQTLVVGDLENPQEILVNREILVQRSRYFNMLFQPNFLEASETVVVLKDINHTTKLQGIDYEGFLYLLRYIYTGKTHVPLELCPIVSQLADMYLEPYLKCACDHTIKEALKANSAQNL